MPTEKLDFATPEWIELVRGVMEKSIAAAAEAGEIGDDFAFSMCEVYTHVPASISPSGRVAWHVKYADRQFAFETEEADDVDVKIVGEYDVIRPHVKVPFVDGAPTPEVAAELMAAVQAGRFRMDYREGYVASPLPPSMASLHDDIAAGTR